MTLRKIIAAVTMVAAVSCLACSCGRKGTETGNSGAAMEKYTQGEGAYSVYGVAEEQTDKLSVYHAVFTYTSDRIPTAPSADETTHTDMEVQRMADLSDSENPVAYYSIDYSANGEKLTSTSYYHADGRAYVNDNGSLKVDDESNENVVAAYRNPLSLHIPESLFENAETAEKDGELEIVINSAGEDAAALLNALIGSPDDCEYSAITITLRINAESYLYSFSAEYECTYGDSSKGNGEVSIVFTDIGKKPEIPVPDLSEYAEASDDTSGNADTAAPDSDTSGGWDDISEEEGEAVDAAFELFDENYNRKPDYDKLYKQACDKYGKDTMDAIIETILMFASVNTME